ncbi:S2536 protein, partial [Oxylabes madagascariensis]|nr:S2536 protein [Oxylabes madagascariensis]
KHDDPVYLCRCGGTVGAILTCPLEVVKTRLQSSSVTLYISEVHLNTVNGATVNRVTRVSPGPLHCLKMILQNEGPRSLFRGLGPNLVGVAPSRAIYFAAYSNCKEKLNNIFNPDSTQVHMISAGVAGKDLPPKFVLPNIFATDFLYLKYQSLSSQGSQMVCFLFWRAVLGVSITQFLIHFSSSLTAFATLAYKTASAMDNEDESAKEASDFVRMMMAAATSKTCATSIAYPHEVVRTRLREEGTKYRSFFQTLSLLVREEGYGSLYRGLTTHLIRQIPNTAIMMSTYEVVVYLLDG